MPISEPDFATKRVGFFRSYFKFLPNFTLLFSRHSSHIAMADLTQKKPEGLALYSRFAFAGAVCCSATHGAFTPVDVYVVHRYHKLPANY